MEIEPGPNPNLSSQTNFYEQHNAVQSCWNNTSYPPQFYPGQLFNGFRLDFQLGKIYRLYLPDHYPFHFICKTSFVIYTFYQN